MPQTTPVLDKEGRLSVRKMWPSDVVPLSNRLASIDRRELEQLGIDPMSAFQAGYETGGYTGLVDDEPEAAFGVNTAIDPAAIWFLGSRISRMHRVSFTKLCKRWVLMLTRDHAVANVVPADNLTTISWLRSLDFDFEDGVYTINGHDFCRFHRRPLTSHLPH